MKIPVYQVSRLDMNPRLSENDSNPGVREVFEMCYRNNFLAHSKHLCMILHLFTALVPTPFASVFLLMLLKQRTRMCMAPERHYLKSREEAY
jgi:hypothetical protein